MRKWKQRDISFNSAANMIYVLRITYVLRGWAVASDHVLRTTPIHISTFS